MIDLTPIFFQVVTGQEGHGDWGHEGQTKVGDDCQNGKNKFGKEEFEDGEIRDNKTGDDGSAKMLEGWLVTYRHKEEMGRSQAEENEFENKVEEGKVGQAEECIQYSVINDMLGGQKAECGQVRDDESVEVDNGAYRRVEDCWQLRDNMDEGIFVGQEQNLEGQLEDTEAMQVENYLVDYTQLFKPCHEENLLREESVQGLVSAELGINEDKANQVLENCSLSLSSETEKVEQIYLFDEVRKERTSSMERIAHTNVASSGFPILGNNSSCKIIFPLLLYPQLIYVHS